MKKFFLNKTHGINNINKISLKKIIEIFSLPKDVNISLTNDEISIELRLKYDNLEISYILYFFVENLKKPEFHTLTFFIKKLYLNIKENIRKIFKNDKIVFLTNIITYVMFAIIVYLMQNSIVQEIKLGQRNNTCK